MHKIAVEYFDPADGAAFEASYRARHVPLVKQLSGLERFTLSFPSTPGAPNLVAELWFADGDAVSRERRSGGSGARRTGRGSQLGTTMRSAAALVRSLL